MTLSRSVRCALAVVALSAGMSFPAHVARAQDSTSTVHYKGVSLSPIGFAAAEAVWRQRNITADIGSSFNAIPFPGTTNGSTSEFRATGRQSRIGLLATAKPEGMNVTGYMEADFLGVGTSSNGNESNSYPLRLRHFFGSVGFDNGWTLAAGQMWSFVTTDKAGLNPRSEMVPLTIEAQYAVGFNWARQFGFRAIQKLGDEASWGFALEAAQTTFSARNAPATIVLGQAGGSTLNATTNYTTDYAPDLIAKIAFDPKGMGHWELKAVGRIMRDRIVNCTATVTTGCSRNANSTAEGVGFGVFYPVMADNRDIVDIGLSSLYGKGIGRYGTSQLADATIAADSSLAPIKAIHALLSIETHPTSQLDIYGYAGAEYADQTTFVNAAGKGVGYGSPLNVNSGCELEFAPTGTFAPGAPGGTTPCNADTRAIWQGNLGFWYRLYKGASGTVQWGMQYSYTSRNTWAGAAGLQPQAIDNMVFSSFRYVLP